MLHFKQCQINNYTSELKQNSSMRFANHGFLFFNGTNKLR